jgi:uncharacterized iron-regulated membrane protein
MVESVLAVHMRRALVQVHLWLGIGLGLYIVMMSVTGSAIVARRELTRHWLPDAIMADGRPRLDSARLRALAHSVMPGYIVTAVRELPPPRRPPYPRNAPRYEPGSVAAPAEVTFERAGELITHRFDPFTGRDLGDVLPLPYRAFLRLVDLHDDLMAGRTGRLVNGVAAIITTLLVITGLVIWWPAQLRLWPTSLWIRRGAPGRTQLRQLHNMLGVWPWLLLLLWALTGVYFAFPGPFEAVKEWFYPPDSPGAPAGDDLMVWLTSLHFGRFGGAGVRVAWIVLGLVPAALFVTGATMWWHNVLRPALRHAQRT